MKILVTGCAGFIGARVCRELLDDGHVVVGVDSLEGGYDPALKEWRLSRLHGSPRFEFARADVGAFEAVERIVAGAGFEAVLNLAARAGVRRSVEDPWPYYATNVVGTLNLLEACRRHDVGTFLLASTSSLYGAGNEVPFREDADTDRPLSPYAASKKAAEALVASYAHLYGVNTPIVRYFTVYGPAGRPDMSPLRFVRWIAEGDPIVVYGDGEQMRDFTYVDDIARGTALALGLRGFEVVNLGGDRPVTLARLIQVIEAALGKPARIERRPRHRADVDATWADIGKARRLMGWEPKVMLEEGIRNTVGWYLENRDWARRIDLGPV